MKNLGRWFQGFGLVATANDVDAYGNTRTGLILIEPMTLAGS